MVVHVAESRIKPELKVNKPQQSSNKEYVVTDYVSEFPPIENMEADVVTPQENISSSPSKKRKRKISKISKSEDLQTSPAQNNQDTISKSDLEELRRVYEQCKAIVDKIESKYGHLLELNTKQCVNTSENAENMKCKCKLSKKIVFDDSGNQMNIENPSPIHICHLKPANQLSNVQVEYTPDATLPEDINSVRDLLKSPQLDKAYRDQLIWKMKSLKEEYMTELRFNKQILIEELKKDPNEHLQFNGTNLSSLTGYEYYK
ncbi:hypothetical protein JYU34_005048 [Plutella xylostella]|uniref:Uncharacterized protein n=1 Tax=Plutella xylostella TaxID=51655 RepID=A0ABQ7QVR6_PLUXY|nr:uncharacterized protein LOC125488772 [Plutella xylostella]KAG7309128.1 hypothetical protein JYU34_005048 [Plutella xylostella]